VLADIRDGAAYSRLATLRQLAFVGLSTDDRDIQQALAVQEEVVGQGRRGLPWLRLLAAAVAQRHNVTLLHYAVDFDLIVSVTGQAAEWIVPRGSVG
jgi:hypothetical protein